MNLRKKSETTTTITLEWDQVPNAVGYRFQNPANAPKWSHTFDPARREVKFSKPGPYKVEALGVEDSGSYPPANPPPVWEGPLRITQGGTYSGSWDSPDSRAAVTIATDQPVRIGNARLRKLGGGNSPLIRYESGNVKLTCERTFFYGGAGRIIDIDFFDEMIFRNCSFDKTAGFKFAESNPGAKILVTHIKGKNIQGPGLGAPQLAQFVQFAVCQGAASIEVAWSEVINEPELSEPEDIISIFKSHDVWVHDIYFEGQYALGNSNDSSQNGITVEQPESRRARIEDTQLAGCLGGIGIFGGDGHQALRNRVVRSGFYPDGVTRVNVGYSGLDIQLGVTNSHAHENLVGYVSGAKHGSTRTDWSVLPAHCQPLNTHYPGTVTRQSELDERLRWQQKLQANGITIGA